MPERDRTAEKVYRGIPVSGGVSRGAVYVLAPSDNCIPHRKISLEEISSEMERLEKALIQTRQQIMDVQRQVEEAMGAEDASIFDAHLLVLEAHVSPRPVGLEGCHNDGDPTNNVVGNLRWDTHSANLLDIARHARERVA